MENINSKKKVPIIAILGDSNKGKTFVMEELTQTHFPNNYFENSPYLYQLNKNLNENQKNSFFEEAILIECSGNEISNELVR